jgi:DNA-binding transcriptional MerR regulator
MLKIGEFSKFGQVSVKTSRYYDSLGLLTPQMIDPITGDRYYSFDLLPRLNRILALKEFGFSLEQIDQLLNNDLTAEQLRGMLRLKQAEIQQ